MNISICLFGAYLILVIILRTVFKTVCFFKKSCKWKKCPFRSTPYDLGISMCTCEKCVFPFDEKEEKEFDETIERLENLIAELRNHGKD